MNILERANGIITNLDEEKERQYGNIDDSMRAQEIIYEQIANEDDDHVVAGYKRMLALKLARTRIYAREDTLLDLVAYAAAYNNYLNKQNEE